MTLHEHLYGTYQQQMDTFEWRLRALLIKRRDKFTCTRCGDKHEQLEVHHLQYASDERCVWQYSDEYLTTLCKSCHFYVHADTPISTFYSREVVPMWNFPKELMEFLDGKKLATINEPVSKGTWTKAYKMYLKISIDVSNDNLGSFFPKPNGFDEWYAPIKQKQDDIREVREARKLARKMVQQ